MAYVTLDIGPTWRMELLRGLLEEHGLPAVLKEDSPPSVVIGQAPSTSRLQVPEEVVQSASKAVAEAQRDGSRALENLRFRQHERYSAPQPLRAMLVDVAFWLVLFLIVSLVIASLF